MRTLPRLALLPVLAALLSGADAPRPADRPVPLGEVAARATVPPGFAVTLAAGEPMVVQPIAMTTDDRGRLWVVECLSYPEWSSTRPGRDRVTVLEDTDGDGAFDKRTVFLEGGKNLSSVELGHGGVWLCSLPNLLFVPCDFNADAPKPSGPAQVVLDGWSLECKHNVVNGLIWGPDGWLWGLNGITTTSHVGKPGTPQDKRTPINCGVWRIHPHSHEFQVVCTGTTNPFGLDFDDYGQGFFTNCVIDHLWQAIPGAHYERMFGSEFDPAVFEPMRSTSDHKHWAGGHWTASRDAKGGPLRRRRRARALGVPDLPRRAVPPRVSQLGSDGQHPRQPPEPRPAGAQPGGAMWGCARRTSSSPTTRGSALSPSSPPPTGRFM